MIRCKNCGKHEVFHFSYLGRVGRRCKPLTGVACRGTFYDPFDCNMLSLLVWCIRRLIVEISQHKGY